MSNRTEEEMAAPLRVVNNLVKEGDGGKTKDREIRTRT